MENESRGGRKRLAREFLLILVAHWEKESWPVRGARAKGIILRAIFQKVIEDRQRRRRRKKSGRKS
jgi:hypothetical protein